jgi:hypothetical protein
MAPSLQKAQQDTWAISHVELAVYEHSSRSTFVTFLEVNPKSMGQFVHV